MSERNLPLLAYLIIALPRRMHTNGAGERAAEEGRAKANLSRCEVPFLFPALPCSLFVIFICCSLLIIRILIRPARRIDVHMARRTIARACIMFVFIQFHFIIVADAVFVPLVRLRRTHAHNGPLGNKSPTETGSRGFFSPRFAFFFSNKETRSLARIYSLLSCRFSAVFLLVRAPLPHSVRSPSLAFSAFSFRRSVAPSLLLPSALCLVNVFMLGARCNNKYREFGFKFSELLVHFSESNWVDGVARPRHRASSPRVVFLSPSPRSFLFIHISLFLFVSSDSSILVVSNLGARRVRSNSLPEPASASRSGSGSFGILDAGSCTFCLAADGEINCR